MIKFDKFQLHNGLRVIVQKDDTTPIVAVNLTYNVGARDEDSNNTGFAHLFEHLMFGGSQNIADFDKPLQQAGGENNAYTTNDITNYYIKIPKSNLETAFWLESDRMLKLDFSQQKLDIQKAVVIEEFNQRYFGQPYGDVWLLLRPLAYKIHPYKWATIGKEIAHIEKAKLEEVEEFFYQHYAPNNAVLAVVGNVETDEVKQLAEKWFGTIEARNIKTRQLEKEPPQLEERKMTVERDVPYSAIYKAWQTCERLHPDFYAVDMLSDILSNGKSTRFYQRLVVDKGLFSSIDAYITASFDAGLFVIEGTLAENITMQDAENAINLEIAELMEQEIDWHELQKVKNKIEAQRIFAKTTTSARAEALAIAEIIADAELINSEELEYEKITSVEIINVARKYLGTNNCSTLYYLARANSE